MKLSLLLLGLILRLDCGAGKLEKLPLTSCQQRVQFVASAVTNPDSVKWRNATTTTGLATIDFDFLPAKHANITGNLTKPKKFTSRDAARLLQHRRIILVGNSMLRKLAEASIFLLGCCGEDIPRSLANSHPNSVEKAGQMIWHNGMSKNAYHGTVIFTSFAVFKPVPLTSLLALAVRTDLAVAAPTNPNNRCGRLQRPRARAGVSRPSTMAGSRGAAHVPEVPLHRRHSDSPAEERREGAHAVFRGLRPLQRPHRRRRQ